MRRAVLTLGGTVAGLAALFSFRSHSAVDAAAISTPSPVAPAAGAPASPSPGATSSPLKPPTTKPSAVKSAKAATMAPTPMAPASTAPASVAPSTAAPKTTPPTAPATHKPTAPAPTPSSAPATATPSSAAPETFTGDNENTQYGPMQVQITVAGSKITAVNELQQPDDSIASNAITQLDSETLSAQSASIQAVSGATYTSNGYIESLQSALDQAGL